MKKHFFFICTFTIAIINYLITTFFEFDYLNNLIFISGFRFFPLLIAFFILIIFLKRNQILPLLKKSFSVKESKLTWLIIFLPILLIGTILYFIKQLQLNDPEYFYELGLSSIIDFPLYFVWNLPQLIILFLTLNFIALEKFGTLKSLFLIVFIYPFPFFESETIRLITYSILLLIIFISHLRFKNVLHFTLILFSTIWLSVLLFGTTNETVVNIFLAKNFIEWEGFFLLSKNLKEFEVIFALAIYLILISVSFILRPKENFRNFETK